MSQQSMPQICVSKIHEQTNQRISDRNIPSQMLQPYLNVRPVMTKYSYFPIIDPRKPINVPLKQMPTYNVNTMFNPGNDTAPWSGFASNINLESELRNQVFALQKCSQATYVPTSNSDLYDYNFRTIKEPNPHELLFQNDSFSKFNPNPDPAIVGSNLFLNSTRTQVRDLTRQTC
jgi:hypothetical protein